jgi:NAD(P)H dehydrogenase (quinone)
MTQTLLVTGASGHLGRRVVDLLRQAGADRIIATTRSPEKLADMAEKGVEVRQADYDQPEGLASAFAGADRLLLISTDALMVPGHRLTQHRAAIAAAIESGVKHVVYTSLINPEPGASIAFAGDHYGTEQALAASGLDWTALRNNVYTETLLMNLPRAIASGQLMAAAEDGGVGYVTREDCARAAAAALNATTSGQKTIDITGPDVVTYADLAQIASELSGKPVSYVNVPLEAIVNGMVGAGMPQGLAETLASFQTATANGELGVTSDAITQLTGTPPQSVRDFLLAHKEALLTTAR